MVWHSTSLPGVIVYFFILMVCFVVVFVFLIILFCPKFQDLIIGLLRSDTCLPCRNVVVCFCNCTGDSIDRIVRVLYHIVEHLELPTIGLGRNSSALVGSRSLSMVQVKFGSWVWSLFLSIFSNGRHH